MNKFNSKVPPNLVFQRGMSFLDKSLDDEIEEEIAAFNMQRSWNGRVGFFNC